MPVGRLPAHRRTQCQGIRRAVLAAAVPARSLHSQGRAWGEIPTRSEPPGPRGVIRPCSACARHQESATRRCPHPVRQPLPARDISRWPDCRSDERSVIRHHMRRALPGPEKSDYATLIRPTDCRSIKVRPADCRSIKVRPADCRSIKVRPADCRSIKVRPADCRSIKVRPADCRSIKVRPADCRSIKVRPADCRSIKVRPANCRSIKVRPADCRSIKVRPADCRSIDVHPHTVA